MTVIVRFAPSPTGRLHVGNLRPAIFNWLFAQKAGGTFILRFDDTDIERSREEFVDAIRTDLSWLGLAWDREFRQSDRSAQYQAALDQLAASGRAYPCFETAADLDRKRKRQLARGLPPVYDRAALKLSPDEIAAKRAAGAVPHWRFKLDQVRTPWDDLIRGPQEIDAGSLSDPVIAREDGSFLYTFTSVVDDAAEAISHIIRGEDHVANTAVQIQLFEALGAPVPLFAHHNLLVGADGQALSKRLGSLAIGSFREGGYEPLAVACHAALIGTSDPVAPLPDMAALADLFDFAKLSRAPARFDPEELRALNGKLLQSLSYQAVADRLEALNVAGGEPFWLAVRGNIAVFADVIPWWRLIAEPVQPVIAEPEFCAKALAVLPDAPWDTGTWDQWTAAVKAQTGAKGRALFMPLRLALTGLEHGPELKYLLPLMGRERVAKRLTGVKA